MLIILHWELRQESPYQLKAEQDYIVSSCIVWGVEGEPVSEQKIKTKYNTANKNNIHKPNEKFLLDLKKYKYCLTHI